VSTVGQTACWLDDDDDDDSDDKDDDDENVPFS
jgi:hypothetical protein